MDVNGHAVPDGVVVAFELRYEGEEVALMMEQAVTVMAWQCARLRPLQRHSANFRSLPQRIQRRRHRHCRHSSRRANARARGSTHRDDGCAPDAPIDNGALDAASRWIRVTQPAHVVDRALLRW